MFNESDARQLIGTELHASDDKVGKIGQVYLDDQTGKPEWATVNTGFFGTSESFVPLEGASRHEDGVAVPYTKNQVKDAPNVDPSNGHISESQEADLYRHYGLSYSESRSDSGLPDETAGTAGTPHADTGHETGHVAGHGAGQESVVRSEEELNVGKERVETGRARLRKYAVTEEENITVPVKKEKVRLETEPLTDEDRARGVGGISEEDAEVTLSEERVVVDKETVAKEKVGLRTEVEEHEETVSEDVRKERVEVEGDVDDTRR